jgi:DNA-binding SARP family transcriptional activator
MRGRALAHQLVGLARAMRGEHAVAVPEMDRSLVVARASGDAWLHAVLTMRRALVHLMGGAHAAAEADYQAAVPALRAMGEWWFLSLTHEGQAMNAFARGDLATAARRARASVQVLREEPDPWFVSRGLDTLATILAAGDGRARNDAHATLAVRAMGMAEALRRRCGAAVIGHDRERRAGTVAALRARLGEADFAAEHARGEALGLDDAFALVADDAPFAGIPGAASGQAGASAPAARPTPAAATPTTPAAALTTASAPRALRLDALGPLAIARDGRALPADALPAGKVRELLLYFLVHEQATKDAVGLALWPDASSAQVRNAFHVTLHHLRRLLGDQRWIAFERNVYRLDRAPAPGVTLDADVDAVLGAAARLRAAARRQERLDEAALDAGRAALDRMRGEFAAGVLAEDWVVAHQDRVRAAWADGMDALARLYAAAGRPGDTVAVCEALVAREPLRESAHRLLMEAHVARGEPARALAHHEALVALLAREVGAPPARETRALADAIRRGAARGA